MKTKLALSLVLLSGLSVTSAQANECTTDALVQATQRFQSQIVSYGQAHENDSDAAERKMMQAMSEAGVNRTFEAHADELKAVTSDPDEEPSQALCDDMYAMFDKFDAKVDALD
ncbi:hypothetical protein [Salinicola halophilus]|uniref:hypothetical protein n=1 Tax=Salinicola halophilus TaxID=184065 RepID=UPI000DA23201|nr:hypothetical protein [Salinicola halophilus]